MKHIIFFIWFSLASLFIFSQRNSTLLREFNDIYDNTTTKILKTNPGTILIGPIIFTSEYRIVFEMPVYLNYGIQIGVSYLGENIFLKILDSDTTTIYGLPAKPNDMIVNGFRIQLSYKRYIFQKYFGYSPFGIYIGIHYSFSKAYITLKSLNLFKKHIYAVHENYNLITGYQLDINKFVFDSYLGIGYKNNFWAYRENYNSIQKIDGLYFNLPIKLLLGINIGYSF